MKVSRLLSIIIILIDKKRISARELADIFEVSTRTIYRDIETISMAGIPVHSTPGAGGGFEIMENYKMDKNTFSEADLATLLVGISSIPKTMQSKSFTNTLTKIESFIPVNQVESIHSQRDLLHVDFSPWMGNRNLEPYLSIIKTALRESKILSFEYINHSGNKTTRRVEPYQLVIKSSDWYFQGYCYKRNDFRLFKLTRLTNLKLEDTVFVPKEYQKPLLDTTEIQAKFQLTIKLRIHLSIMEQLLDYCDYDKFLPVDDNHYLVEFPFIENDFHYGVLLSFGERCECLEPLHIRSELKRKIANLSQIYDT